VTRALVVATRKSPLALAQARAFVAELTQRSGRAVTELLVTTTGDRITDAPLANIGGKGLFLKEIEEALLDGRADFAVHSMKDVPAELAKELVIACVPKREDPRDVLVSRSGARFTELPAGSVVGTSSLRRSTVLREARPDLTFVPVRGNVDTRLRKCAEGQVDAVILAFAGLRRLGLAEKATEVLDVAACLPAVGQGALAIECRAADDDVRSLLASFADEETARSVAAERGVMTAVEGSCQVPVAAHASHEGPDLWLRALLANSDGTGLRRNEVRVPWPASDDEAFSAGVALGRKLRVA